MTEHAGVIFVFFFLGEYASILLMCILISVFFLGGYLGSMFYVPENFYFINTFIEDWTFKVWQFLFYNELYLNDAIKSSTIYYIDFMIYTIFIYIFNEILFIIYDIITLISDYYIDLGIIVNNNENEDLEVLLLEGVSNALILGLKSSIFVFIFIWIRASFPRIRYDQLMSLCWTVLLPLLFAFIFFVPCTLYSFDSLPANISLLSSPVVPFLTRYHQETYSKQANIKMNDQEFIEWFTGFVDGEGLFYVGISSKNVINTSFRIKLHIEDMKALEFIKNELNCGNVYINGKAAIFCLEKKMI